MSAVSTMARLTSVRAPSARPPSRRSPLARQPRVQPATTTGLRPHQHRAAAGVLRSVAVDKDAVLSDIRAIIAEQLGADLDGVKPESKFADLGADSLDTVEIMMAIEEKFGVTVEEDDAQKVTSVQEVSDYIAAKTAAGK